MNDDEYVKYLMARTVAAEMQVAELENKLRFWRTTGIGLFGLTIILTLMS